MILSATVIAAEIGDLRRFKTVRQFMAFLGLVPSESSSGNSVKRGSLTKTGNGHVRRILIEVAQQRLCSRLTHFTNSDKPRNKAIVALARFIWSLGQVSQLLA